MSLTEKKTEAQKGKEAALGYTAGYIWLSWDYNLILFPLSHDENANRTLGGKQHINHHDSFFQSQRMNVLTTNKDPKWKKVDVIFSKCFYLLLFWRATTPTTAHHRSRWPPTGENSPSPSSNNAFAMSSLELVPRTRRCLDEHFCLLTICLSSKAVFPPSFQTLSTCQHNELWPNVAPWVVPKVPVGPANHYVKINQTFGRRKLSIRYQNKPPFIKQIRHKHKSTCWTAARRKHHQNPCKWRLESVRNPFFLLKIKNAPSHQGIPLSGDTAIMPRFRGI